MMNLKGSIFYIQKGNYGESEIKKQLTRSLSISRRLGDFVTGTDEDSPQARKMESLLQQKLFWSKDYEEFSSQDIGKFTSNNKSVIFWNNDQCWYLDLENVSISQLKFNKINIKVDPKEQMSYIKRIRASSTVDTITIVVRQTSKSDCFLVWDMTSNCEKEAFDRGTSAMVMFDATGNTYIAEDDMMTVCEQGVMLKSY